MAKRPWFVLYISVCESALVAHKASLTLQRTKALRFDYNRSFNRRPVVRSSKKFQKAEEEGLDYDRIKALNTPADIAARIEMKRKRKKNPDQGFSSRFKNYPCAESSIQWQPLQQLSLVYLVSYFLSKDESVTYYVYRLCRVHQLDRINAVSVNGAGILRSASRHRCAVQAPHCKAIIANRRVVQSPFFRSKPPNTTQKRQTSLRLTLPAAE